MQQTDPLIGTNLDGYVIEELLGQGGMGHVYRALDAKLNRYAAVKVLNVDLHEPRHYEQRFYREAQAIAKLRHPNIVSIYRFNDLDSLFYMAMEYVDGADLRWVLKNYLADRQLMDYETVIAIIEQIAQALDYAHKNGVIHRDIKPPNIMISRDGTAILTDFGLALDTAEGTVGEIFGSPHYIAPEQAINSADAVPQSDIYSLGVILYEMLTSTVPFRDGSMIEIAMAHIHDPIPDPRSINPDLHPSFIPILQKVLAKDIQDRYQNAARLVTDLKSAIRTVEKTYPSRVHSTLTKPAERIAQNIKPLRLPTSYEATKVLSQVKEEVASPPRPARGHEAQRSRRRSPLLRRILMLLIIVTTMTLVYRVRPQLLERFIPVSSVHSTQTTNNAVVEGRIEAIDDNTATLLIFALPVQIDRNHPLWTAAEVGDIVYIEGQAHATETGLHFDHIGLAIRNGEELGEGDN